MPRTRRQDDETKKETTNPPNELPKNHVIACAAQNEGRDIWRVTLPAGEEILVELSVRFRSNCQFRRGSYVLVDRAALADRENKLGGEIVNIVGDDKVWQKMAYWPPEFAKRNLLDGVDDEAESIVGKLPPEESEDDETARS